MKIAVNVLILVCLLFSGCKTSESEKKEEAQTEISASQADSSAAERVVAKKFTGSEDVSDLKKISGMLNYSGNEPFARPTIFVSDTLSYLLNADSVFIKKTYSSINGKHATLYGKEKETAVSNVFEVHYYEINEE